MKIAVLMSTYNGASFLEEQLNSIACQTVAKNMTVYIRDDGSSDSTQYLISPFMAKCDIRLIKGKNIGPANSFWELLINQNIQADYYAFADQDDIWDVDKLETAIRVLEQQFELYLCNCRLINRNSKVISNSFREVVPIMTIPRQCICGMGHGCAMVFTDDLRKKIIESNIECIPMHDTVVMLYALGYGKVYYDLEPRFSYRMHEDNVVAKNGKGFIGQIMSSIKNWKSNAKNSMADVATEMLFNNFELEDSDREYLENLSKYKKSFKAKRRILKYEDVNGITPQALRSYRIRVWLNLF